MKKIEYKASVCFDVFEKTADDPFKFCDFYNYGDYTADSLSELKKEIDLDTSNVSDYVKNQVDFEAVPHPDSDDYTEKMVITVVKVTREYDDEGYNFRTIEDAVSEDQLKETFKQGS